VAAATPELDGAARRAAHPAAAGDAEVALTETTYRFAPHPGGGVLLGLRVPQLCGLALAAFGALGALRLGGLGGLGLAAVIVAATASIVLVPLRGQTLEQWAPLVARFAFGRLTGAARFRAQRAQLGHLVRLPHGELDPQTAQPPESRPAELAELELMEVTLTRYEDARLGVVKDGRAHTYTATVRVSGRAFALLAPEDREARLEEYGAVLAALARDDSPVRRVAWIERTLPADADALGSYLLQAKRPDASFEEPPDELVSYLQLIGRAGDVAEEHELLFTLQIDARRPAARRAITRIGGGDLGALAVLAGEVGQLIELLDQAAITVTGLLTRAGLAAAIRSGYDPWGHRQRQRQLDPGGVEAGIEPHTAAPTARDDHWGHLHVDGALHCTFWVAEWPRVDVRALFLQPLLMDTRITRTVAMVMELVGPGKAQRHAERAATEAATEQTLRGRIGQRTSQRQAQRDQAALQRERELAEGHAAVRYATYVTVSVPATPGGNAVDELEAAASRIELEAKRAPLRLERMWGQQAEAFTYTLPLGRGLR
jgi:hypothetical protein